MAAEADVLNLTTEKTTVTVTRNNSEKMSGKFSIFRRNFKERSSTKSDSGSSMDANEQKCISEDAVNVICIYDNNETNTTINKNDDNEDDRKIKSNECNGDNNLTTKWYIDFTVEQGLNSNKDSLNKRHSWHLDDEIKSFPSTTSTEDSMKPDPFSSSLSNQIRAVSSPSLSENPIENIQSKSPSSSSSSSSSSAAAAATATAAAVVTTKNRFVPSAEIISHTENSPVTSAANYAGVIQKFKKTFAQFKTTTTTLTGTTVTATLTSTATATPTPTAIATTITGITTTGKPISYCNSLTEVDSAARYKFGPLIWRSSKERRKTKYNRRDKCNSGDSGIQIELENDENYVGEGPGSAETLPSLDNIVRIRRVNSAKATSNSMTTSCSSAKTKALKKIENNNENNRMTATPLPTRSLSQPSGLDRMARTDIDESDTDSVSSHPDLHEGGTRSIFAEVLFPFAPAGPQELALEKGSLVEVLRKDGGAWWYGRIKHDEIIAKVIEPKQGWFPKDFVRVIPLFYGMIDTIQQNDERKRLNLMLSSSSSSSITAAAAKASSSLSNNTLEFKKCDTRLNSTSSSNSSNSSNNSNNNNNNNNNNNSNSNSSSSNNSGTTTILSAPSKVILTSSHPPPSSSSSLSSSSSIVIASAASSAAAVHSNSSNSQNYSNTFNENLRNNAIRELLETEINYVKLLSSLCLGYLKELRKRIDIFSTESLNLIFANIENVWSFQQTFLDALRKGIETGRIAQVFLDHQSGFFVYSTYCNSYPRALMELESYSNSKEAKCVLENCRVAENLPELPLSAHLLAPIQRICRYPLHLAELVKHTPTRQEMLSQFKENNYPSSQNIIDCKETLQIALSAMKNVTEKVNEGKRHSEHLTRFQASFENFQGPPIAFHSTRFFMQTDATRVSPNLWNNTYTLFLFDHQLIYCKKDILKRNHYIYKGRIFLDSCRILNLRDGKLFGTTLKNALRIFCQSRNKWFDFCFRSPSRKLRFLSALTIERQFCGSNLFVTELPGEDDENLSDREYHSDYDASSPTTRTARASATAAKMGGGRNANTLERDMNMENFYNMNSNWKDGQICEIGKCEYSKLKKQISYSETMPKKSRKVLKDTTTTGGKEVLTDGSVTNGYEYGTSSLGRRRIGNWFRKAKSTNSTPTQSPTHHHQSTVMIMGFNNSSDSSSQSSPALGYSKSTITGNKSKMKETATTIQSS